MEKSRVSPYNDSPERVVSITIEGISPLMMHRFPMEPIEAIEKKTPQEQAEIAAHRDAETGELFIPGIAVQNALVAGAAYSKGKGRSSLKKVAAACLIVYPEKINLGTKHYVIDSRPVVIKVTGSRVMRHRPRLDKWRASFQVSYNRNLITEEQLRRVVEDTGSFVGLLEYRPSRNGPFGRFRVVEWKS